MRQEQSKYCFVHFICNFTSTDTPGFCSDFAAEGPGAAPLFEYPRLVHLQTRKGRDWDLPGPTGLWQHKMPSGISWLSPAVQTSLHSPVTMDWLGIYLTLLGLWLDFLVHVYILIHDIFLPYTPWAWTYWIWTSADPSSNSPLDQPLGFSVVLPVFEGVECIWSKTP